MLHFFIIYFRYEIGDGQSYLLPDVIADFSNVKVGTVNEGDPGGKIFCSQMTEVDEGVHVSGALGRAPTDTYKISATYLDGYKVCLLLLVMEKNEPHISVFRQRVLSALLGETP